MTLTKTLPLVMLLAMATPVLAQTATETETDAAAAEEAPADPLALAMGEEDASDSKIGDIYVDGEFGDWEVRCIKSEAEVDPCQMYQLLLDPNDSPVAEINIFPLPGGEGQPAAGATVITPLESLLTQQLGLSVDGGKVRKYPYSWCSQIGCFSRMGFSKAEVDQFRRGNAATLVIVPVAAPDQKVNLTVSLKGFTAGFKDVADRSK